MKNFANITIKQGIEFEGCFLQALKVTHAQDVQWANGTPLDYEQGTDAIVYGVPTDITANITHKDNMEMLPETIRLSIRGHFFDIHFGIRTANIHHRFNKPVFVMGVDLSQDRWLAKEADAIYDVVKNNIETLIDAEQDLYWSWCDEHETAV